MIRGLSMGRRVGRDKRRREREKEESISIYKVTVAIKKCCRKIVSGPWTHSLGLTEEESHFIIFESEQ